MKRKLIEVALPLDAINAASAREKSIRHGHPSTLHLWWARRPLAACRAVLFAQLVDDPSAHPEEFPTEEDQDRERERLFGIIEELVKWENTTNEEVLNAARAEILRSTGGDPPPILDPFAGGGSIPLEAQRLGLEAHASDLNPVAVLINKALIEIPPKWADMPPVHPDAERRTHWRGAEGLAEDVRLYGKWMRDEAERRIGHLYPKAKLEDGSEADVIAWIWARTVTCPNPACGATMPLASTFWLGKKKGKEAWIRPIVDHDAKTVRFEIGHGPEGPPDPPKIGRGANFRCLVCEQVADDAYIKAEGMAGRMSAQLMAVAAEGASRREYLPPAGEHLSAPDRVGIDRSTVATGAVPARLTGGTCFSYGLTRWNHLFTDRQLAAITVLSDLVAECTQLVSSELVDADDGRSSDYPEHLATYLAFAVSRSTNRWSTLSGWDSSPKMEAIRSVFARQALPMTWDFAEGNSFSQSSGNFVDNVDACARAIEMLPTEMGGHAEQLDAIKLKECGVIATDPPYYDNIAYADLADYFYTWLRHALKGLYPALLATIESPKDAELIAAPYRHGGSRAEAESFFQRGFVEVFERFKEKSLGDLPMTFFYAFKQSESGTDDGLISTGWSTMLEGLLEAGWSTTATWPIRTELANKIGMGSNLLASSVVLACRPRASDAGLTDRQGFVRELGESLPSALHELQKAHIAPVDLRQAAIGPGMAVFSKYAKVVEPDGSAMRVRTALGLINQMLDQVLGEQEAEFDAQTRWAVQWFSQFFEDEGPYGTAEALATAMAISVDGMRQAGILESGGGRVRLLGRDEYPDGWDPNADVRVPVWEACQHLVKRLEEEGEAAAGGLLAQLGGLGESAQLLAYRLYTVCEKSRPALAGPYNALVASWPEIQRHARNQPSNTTTQTPNEQQTFET